MIIQWFVLFIIIVVLGLITTALSMMCFAVLDIKEGRYKRAGTLILISIILMGLSLTIEEWETMREYKAEIEKQAIEEVIGK